VLGGAFLGVRPASAATPGTTGSQRRLLVTGPVRGGRHGRPFGAYFGDISQHGYVEEEYFVSGEAQRYQPVGSLSLDGRWTVEPAGTAPFKTRILVRRPRDRAKFNGTVIVEWTNVTAGYEIASADSPAVYDGMAHVAISAQYVGLHGFAGGKAQGLLQWDTERYGALSHPGDSCSYDIFSQVARLLGPKRNANIDPLGGLRVTKLVAVGASQSAARLTSYVNAIQPRDKVFDAFMLVISGGRASGFDDMIFNASDPAMRARFRTSARLRDDLAAKLMVVNSEAETLAFFPVRQPDTLMFRYWEVAGASHAPTDILEMFDEKVVRDGLPALTDPRHHSSDVAWRPSYDAALAHMQGWLHGGPPPPAQPKINVVACETPLIERDVYGNAKGGIRLPELVVPVARYQGLDERPGGGGLSGLSEPFTAEILSKLYPTRSDYVAQVTAAARAAEAAGVILPYRTQQYIRQAELQFSG
jgi:hypothetical protein